MSYGSSMVQALISGIIPMTVVAAVCARACSWQISPPIIRARAISSIAVIMIIIIEPLYTAAQAPSPR